MSIAREGSQLEKAAVTVRAAPTRCQPKLAFLRSLIVGYLALTALPFFTSVATLYVKTRPNDDPVRLLCMPLINHVKRLAEMGSRFARKITPPKFHLFERDQCAGGV